MKPSTRHFAGILLCCGMLSGCASLGGAGSASSPVVQRHDESQAAAVNASSRRGFLLKAEAYESKGDLRMALWYLKIAARIPPADKEIAASCEALSKRLRQNAEASFKEGLALYRQNRMDNARQAFLNALRNDPEHEKALFYLKTKFSPFAAVSYKTEKGESRKNIAAKLFRDPDKAFLISYFNPAAGNQDTLPEGMVLTLPDLESFAPEQAEAEPPPQEVPPQEVPPPPPEKALPEKTPSPTYNIAFELARAEGLLKDKHYDEVLSIADQILDHDYLNLDAEVLINKVYYGKGRDLFEQQRYLEAQTALGLVDPEYIPTEELLAKIRTLLEKQAEVHYLNGVKFFINEELQQAISEWEVVLKLNPLHEKAGSDILKARQLLQKLQDME